MDGSGIRFQVTFNLLLNIANLSGSLDDKKELYGDFEKVHERDIKLS